MAELHPSPRGQRQRFLSNGKDEQHQSRRGWSHSQIKFPSPARVLDYFNCLARPSQPALSSSPTLTHGPGSAPRHRPPLSPGVAGAAGHENWGDAGCREGQESPTAAKGFLGSRENGFHGIQRNSSDKTPACLCQPRFLLISLVPGVNGFTVKLRCPPGLPQRGFC